MPHQQQPSQQHIYHSISTTPSSFTNYPSQSMRNMNNTPSTSYQSYQNTSSDPLSTMMNQPQLLYNKNNNNTNSTNIMYSSNNNNNNNISNNSNISSNGFGYNNNNSGRNNNNPTNGNSYFQNSQYNNSFGQPQQSMNNYHQQQQQQYGTTFVGPTTTTSSSSQPMMNNNSSGFIHSSHDLSSLKQPQQHPNNHHHHHHHHHHNEIPLSKPPTTSQIVNNSTYYSTTTTTTPNTTNSQQSTPMVVMNQQQQQKTGVDQNNNIPYQSPPSNSTAFTEQSKNKLSPTKTPTNSNESNEDSASEEESTNSPNARRAKKSTRACEACRRHHRKCDGGTPCQTCSGKGINCVYTERKKRGPKNEATKLLKREIEELRETLNMTERMKSEWEQKCKELAKMAGVSIILNDQSMPVFTNFPEHSNNTLSTTTGQQQSSMIMDNNNQVFPTTFENTATAMDNNSWNPVSTIPIFSISVSNEEVNNRKRKQVEDEHNDNLKKQKVSSGGGEVIENLDLTKANAIPMDGQRFALSTMVTRFITIWDKFVHPFHSLLPAKWESAMPDLLYDIIRSDGVHSENTFFMYSLLCNSARSLGDIMLSRELHHKAMALYPHHVKNVDPRVGFALVLLSYYSMSVGGLRKAVGYCRDAIRVSEALDRPQLNLQMNAYLSIGSISDDYEERKVNFARLGHTKQICDVIMSVTGDVQNEITHGGNTNYKELIAQMADLLRLKNMPSSNVTLMHEIAIYGILILCLHKAGYKDLALNYGRKLLEISKDSNFKHCCIGTTSSAIAQAASMFLDFEGYPEFYECMSIMDELSMRYELAGLMKKNVEERFVLMSNYLSSGGSSSGSSSNGSPNMVQFL